MPKRTIQIWHDIDGQIIAIGHASADAKHPVIPIAGRNQGVLETQIEEDLLYTLHETHKVDVHNKTLLRKK